MTTEELLTQAHALGAEFDTLTAQGRHALADHVLDQLRHLSRLIAESVA